MTPHFHTLLSLFRSGLDTMEIAESLGCAEYTALKLIHKEREAERERAAFKPTFPKPRKTIKKPLKEWDDL